MPHPSPPTSVRSRYLNWLRGRLGDLNLGLISNTNSGGRRIDDLYIHLPVDYGVTVEVRDGIPVAGAVTTRVADPQHGQLLGTPLGAQLSGLDPAVEQR